jgi:hypothetical protein
MGRFGNSCGTPFIVDEYINKNRVWAYLKPYLRDRPSQPWTLFSSTEHHKKSQRKKKTRKSNRKSDGSFIKIRDDTPYPTVIPDEEK